MTPQSRKLLGQAVRELSRVPRSHLSERFLTALDDARKALAMPALVLLARPEPRDETEGGAP